MDEDGRVQRNTITTEKFKNQSQKEKKMRVVSY